MVMYDAMSMMSLSAIGNAGAEITFFVSEDGNDSWSGKLDSPNSDKTDGPFATITAARDAIREMKAGKPQKQAIAIAMSKAKRKKKATYE